MATTIEIEHDEWEAVTVITEALVPFTSPCWPGVTVETVGRRWWSVTTPQLHVDVGGGDGPSIEGAACLPVDVVRAGWDLSAFDGTVDLVIGGRRVTVGNRHGRVAADDGAAVPHDWPPRPTRRTRPDAPTAQVAVDRLAELFESAARSPLGGARSTPASSVLRLGDDEVELSLEWGRFGGRRWSGSVPAVTSGAASVVVPRAELGALLGAVAEEADLHLMVDEEAGLLWLDGSHWSAAAAVDVVRPMAWVSGPSLSAGVAEVFTTLDRVARVDGAGRELQVYPDEGMVIGVSEAGPGLWVGRRLVVEGVAASADLVAELNQLNRCQPTHSWFVDELGLWVSVVCPATAPDQLAVLVTDVLAASDEFGPLLALLDDDPRPADAPIPGQLPLRLDWGG